MCECVCVCGGGGGVYVCECVCVCVCECVCAFFFFLFSPFYICYYLIFTLKDAELFVWLVQAKKVEDRGQVDFEEEIKRHFKMVYVPNWFSVDLKTGVCWARV